MSDRFIPLPHRAVLSLTGNDTLTLLERLVTNATDDWSDGETRYGALLTPQGKIISDFLAIRTADGVLLDTSSQHVAGLAKRLKMFRLRSQVEIEVLSDLTVIASVNDDTDPASIPTQRVYLDPRYSPARQRALVRSDDVAAPDSENPLDAYHADRIAHGIPEQAADFDTADVFPSDINMDVLGGVALNKGCFVGQEVVSRMHRRGKIRKRSLVVRAVGASNIEPGDEIRAPNPVGTVTSANKSIALGVIRVDRLAKAEEDGETVQINETSVTIEKPDWLVAALAAMDVK